MVRRRSQAKLKIGHPYDAGFLMTGPGFLLLAKLSRPAKQFPGQARRRFPANAR